MTANAGDPQRNLNYYAGVLGLRLVKLTVNFDDPGTYHFYYGNEGGTPGSILTFFPWAHAAQGRQGVGQAGVTSFAIAPEAVAWWVERLVRHGVHFEGPARRFDETVLAFKDPDGLLLELVGHPANEALPAWSDGPVPAAQAIRGLYAVTLWEDRLEATAGLLRGTLGFRETVSDGTVHRFEASGPGAGRIVDVRVPTGFWSGAMGRGTVHHVAWRAPTDEAQQQARASIRGEGLGVTDVLDRVYFRSIYFREPGGVLFEIATDAPGFTVDEPLAELGSGLKLPPWLEAHRPDIIRILPPIELPAAASEAS
ncbi:MAG: ring-cleaving dioxygenase [Gemmatimonadales bacterium]